MATELGKAYVQIMPSARGISGSIQKTLAPEALAAGKSAGSQIARAMADTLSRIGSTLTKSITVPAMGAATAVAGVVSALGFKRLVGMDEAQAKLKGLGIEGKQLEIVMNNARDAVTGTTFTMADGANVAAGALAAGVKEGAELERYIKLVGDAAIGANVPMAEMAQIFNRIQGQGKITRTELDMIEYRLPGFSQALMKHVGAGSQEAFFEMVRAGKVSTDDVLDTMETFAGGMAAAYAETWSGLKDNIIANIGIIGEALLEGLFEDGKKGMAEFLQYLRESEGLKEWARDTGETLRGIFNRIVNLIKTLARWWSNLSDGTKTAILSMAGIVVALGPVMSGIAKVIGVFQKIGRAMNLLKLTFPALGGAIAGLSGPVLAIIAAIAALTAAFVIAYKKSETFRNFVQSAFDVVKTAIDKVIETVKILYETFMSLWLDTGESGDLLAMLGVSPETAELIESIMGTVVDTIKGAIEFIKSIWGEMVAWWQENNELISQTVTTVWDFIKSVIDFALQEIVPRIMAAWEFIQLSTSVVWEAIQFVISTIMTIILGIIKTVMQIINGDWEGAWNTVKETAQKIWDNVKEFISDTVNKIKDTIKEKIDEAKQKAIDKFTELKTKAIDKVIELKTNIKNKFIEIKNEMINKAKEAVDEVIKKIKELPGKIKDKATEFFRAGKNIVQSIIDGIKSKIEDIGGAMSQVAQKVRDFLPFSPPKTGPLRDIMDVKWGETIAGGIEKGERKIENAMEDILSFDLTRQASFESASNMSGNEVVRLLNELIKAVREGKRIIINDREIAEIIEPNITEIQERNNRVRRSFA